MPNKMLGPVALTSRTEGGKRQETALKRPIADEMKRRKWQQRASKQ
jgi:hypothetical protein